MTQLDERPRFYEGQYLEAADLMAAVGYTATQRARMLLGAHRWGIALGLEVVERPGPNQTLELVLTPGYAWDGFGRPIVVRDPAKVPVGLFASFDRLLVPGNPPPPPVVVEVWIRYTESLGQGPRPGFETCEPGAAFARVSERYAIEAGPRATLADLRSPIEVAGRTMDAAQALVTFDPDAAPLVDASVPHQALPEEGEAALWLLPLGVVGYQPGEPGHFIKRDAQALDRHARSRVYAGVVAGSVEATSGTVRVHDRAQPYSVHHTGELLCVEGDVRSDGHVRLYGGRVELVASPLENPRKPVQVARKDDPTDSASSLTLVIGDQPASARERLLVGPKTGVDAAGNDVHAARMVVTAAGRVGIGTDTPRALLNLTEDGLQIGASAAPRDNFHVVSNTDGARGLRFYGGDFGSGTPLMSLSADGRLGIGETTPTHLLHVKGASGLRQNSMFVSGDSRWSSVTFNAHHNDANNAWQFPDPTTPAVTAEMDAISSFPRFEVFTTILGDNQSWSSRFRVHGHTGDVAMGHNGGSVGIGTLNPTAKLDVRGDISASGTFRFGGGLQAVAAALPLRVVWGMVNANGTIANGDGFSCNKTGNGAYDVVWALPYPSPPVVVVTAVADALAVIDPPTSAKVPVQTFTGATSIDHAFSFIAIGPR